MCGWGTKTPHGMAKNDQQSNNSNKVVNLLILPLLGIFIIFLFLISLQVSISENLLGTGLKIKRKKEGRGGRQNEKWSLPSVLERRWRLTRYSLDVYSESQDRGQWNPEAGSRWCERCQSFSEEVTLSWVLKICRSRRKVGDRGTKPLLGEGLAGTKALQWGTPESAESSRQSGMATACSSSMHRAPGWAWGQQLAMQSAMQAPEKLLSSLATHWTPNWTQSPGLYPQVFSNHFSPPLKCIIWNSGLWSAFLF